MAEQQPTKRRIRKACDSCNIKRTKCDGNNPCGHCRHINIECTYLREEKRRGRASDKYPQQTKKRRAKQPLPRDDRLLIASKKPEVAKISHSLINDYHITASGTIPSNRLLQSVPPDFQLGVTRFPILINASADLMKIGMPFEVADELYQYYFDSILQPASKLFSVLRKAPMLESARPTQSNLLLCILLSSATQIDHRFFAGSNRDFACQHLYKMIQEQLPSVTSKFTFDDFLCTVHLGFFMPWLSYISDSVYWWHLAYDVAKLLHLNEIHPTDSNNLIEEKIRGWWGLFILDRLTALCFNLPVAITDKESEEFFLPCNEAIWTQTNEVIPLPYMDPSRIKAFNFDYVRDGMFGWSLNICSLMGRFVQTRRCTDAGLKDQERQQLNQLQLQNLQSITKFQSSLNLNSFNSRNAMIDMLYAKYINQVLIFITQFDSDPETLGNFEYGVSRLQFQRLAQCIETLEDILKLDSGLSRCSFFFSFFLFVAGVSLLSTLTDISRPDNSNIGKLNKYKYYVNVLVRVIEGVISGFPGEFLKTLRNQLTTSIKDCENMIFLTDYIDEFQRNVRKRKEALSAYSWAENGRGLAV